MAITFYKKKKSVGAAKAFSSDTYVQDLAHASKTAAPWTKILIFVIVLSIFADFFLLQDAFAYLFDTDSIIDIVEHFLEGNQTIDIFKLLESGATILVCGAFVALYLTLSYITGKKYSEARAFKRCGLRIASDLMIVLIVIILGFIGFIRYYSALNSDESVATSTNAFMQTEFSDETSSGSSGSFGSSESGGSSFTNSSDDADSAWDDFISFNPEALVRTLGLMVVMGLGALLEFLYSYHSNDAFAAKKKQMAEVAIPEDRALYEAIYFKKIVSEGELEEFEAAERELDRAAIEHSFRIASLTVQLNGIFDPADAYDFTEAEKIVRKAMKNET